MKNVTAEVPGGACEQYGEAIVGSLWFGRGGGLGGRLEGGRHCGGGGEVQDGRYTTMSNSGGCRDTQDRRLFARESELTV